MKPRASSTQDQAFSTRYLKKYIPKQSIESVCRLCNKAEEHISHIVAGYSVLALTEYTNRHNNVASYIHWNKTRWMGSSVPDKYYDHVPQIVTTRQATLLWDFPIITDQEIPVTGQTLSYTTKTAGSA